MNNISNKNLVLDLYKRVIRDRNSDLIDAYISDDYIQHSPSMKDGKAGLRDAIEFLKSLPKPKEDDSSPIILAIADGDYVMLLLDLSFLDKHLLVADLFKVFNGKIVEHWDAIQDNTADAIAIPGFQLTDRHDMKVSESNKTLISSLFNESAPAKIDFNKEFSDVLSQRRPIKLHRILACGNVVGVQSEGIRSGKPFVFYDFINVTESKITMHSCVEQEIVQVLSHNNGMV
ncbi:MAG TPA: nuclear transport factor 2 family protein [Chryseolinea sp.]